MTRRDFEWLAEGFKSAHPEFNHGAGSDVAELQWVLCVLETANVCKRTNSGFKLERFLKACEPKGVEVDWRLKK